MLNKLKSLNANLEVYSVNNPEFAEYGQVISDFDTKEVIAAALKIEKPASGSAYKPSIPELEAISDYLKIKNNYYGGMDIQIGLCWGYNSMLDALEYHKCTEINIAVTDMVVLLARLSDVKDGVLDSADVKAFLVPAGTAIEVYNDTLHYCPCQASDEGFYSVVVLMKGTNEARDFATDDTRLIGKNKWVLFHKDAVPAGGYIGIKGENYKFKY